MTRFLNGFFPFLNAAPVAGGSSLLGGVVTLAWVWSARMDRGLLGCWASFCRPCEIELYMSWGLMALMKGMVEVTCGGDTPDRGVSGQGVEGGG